MCYKTGVLNSGSGTWVVPLLKHTHETLELTGQLNQDFQDWSWGAMLL